MGERPSRFTFHTSRIIQQHFFIGISVLILLLTGTVSAQKSKILTLDDSIQIARQTNLSIQTTQERVKSAEAQVRAAHAGLLPNVSLNSSYRYAGVLQNPSLKRAVHLDRPVQGERCPLSLAWVMTAKMSSNWNLGRTTTFRRS